MLNDEQLTQLTEWFEQQYNKTEQDVFKSLGRDLVILEGLSITELKRLKNKSKTALFNRIDSELNKQAVLSVKELEKVYNTVAKDTIKSAKELYDYRGLVLPSFEDATKPFLTQSIKDIRNLSNTKALNIRDSKGNIVKLKDWYTSRVDEAIGSITSGKQTYEQAISKIVKELGQSGLRVEYESGYTRRLDSAVRQNVLDGMRSVTQKYNEQIGEEIEADGVEITAHSLCAEDHLPYQGKQFTKEEFKKIQNMLPRPIGMFNCKHGIYSIILGVSKPAYTKKELERYANGSNEIINIDGKNYSRYECTQLVNQLRNKSKYVKEELELARITNLKEHQRDLNKQLKQLNSKTNEVLKKAKLREYTTLY